MELLLLQPPHGRGQVRSLQPPGGLFSTSYFSPPCPPPTTITTTADSSWGQISKHAEALGACT
jgi:hypothetical protein